MKVLTRLPDKWLPVGDIAGLPGGDPVNIWLYTEKGSDGRISKRVMLVLYQGVWFGYSEAF